MMTIEIKNVNEKSNLNPKSTGGNCGALSKTKKNRIEI